MNLTRVLNVALPDIPARVLGDKPPRFPPDVIWKEHIEDGQRVVRVVVRGVDAMYRFPPANWELAQYFDGTRYLQRNRRRLFRQNQHSAF